MRAWWRRNRWFAVSLVVLVPAAVFAALLPRAIPYQERQPRAEEHTLGETVRYAGADVTLTALEVEPGWRHGTGDETDLVVASFTIDVRDPGTAPCAIDLVATVDGVERSWDDTAFAGDYRVPEGVESFCSFSEAGEYELRMLYLVPRGVVADPVIEFRSDRELPRVLRLH